MRCSNRSTRLRRRGFDVTLVPPDQDGVVDPDADPGGVRPDTLLVSMMHVNNETGVSQPVAEVADRLEGTDTYLHVDAAQSFGREIDGASASAPRSDQRERAQDQRAEGCRRPDPATP